MRIAGRRARAAGRRGRRAPQRGPRAPRPSPRRWIPAARRRALHRHARVERGVGVLEHHLSRGAPAASRARERRASAAPRPRSRRRDGTRLSSALPVVDLPGRFRRPAPASRPAESRRRRPRPRCTRRARKQTAPQPGKSTVEIATAEDRLSAPPAPRLGRHRPRVPSRGTAASSSACRPARGAREEHVATGAVLDRRPVGITSTRVGHFGDHAHIVGDEDDAVPVSRWSSRISSRICACTVTSSAVVGSSAISSLGLAGERHRDHHPLPHAARELVRILPEPPRRLGDAATSVSSSSAAAPGRRRRADVQR